MSFKVLLNFNADQPRLPSLSGGSTHNWRYALKPIALKRVLAARSEGLMAQADLWVPSRPRDPKPERYQVLVYSPGALDRGQFVFPSARGQVFPMRPGNRFEVVLRKPDKTRQHFFVAPTITGLKLEDWFVTFDPVQNAFQTNASPLPLTSRMQKRVAGWVKKSLQGVALRPTERVWNPDNAGGMFYSPNARV